jgi:ArsR family transcriptional regulator, lead/cadmium/zinc/bismuth-responsive transcriptional repressor
MESNTCSRMYANGAQINACRDKLKFARQAFTALSNILALGGNEARLKIIYLLEDEGELCPCDLSDILGMTIPAISQHLRKLKDGGIVQTRKQGQTIYYSLSQDHLNILKLFFSHINQQTEKLQTV